MHVTVTFTRLVTMVDLALITGCANPAHNCFTVKYLNIVKMQSILPVVEERLSSAGVFVLFSAESHFHRFRQNGNIRNMVSEI